MNQRMCRSIMTSLMNVLLLTLLVAVSAAPAWSAQENIAWSDLGAKATAQYSGDGLAVTPLPSGALRLRCVFQKLVGEVTPEGLWLKSTVSGTANRFRVMAEAVGRAGGVMAALPRSGAVTGDAAVARFTRPGLAEEYSVSVDGVRQDFVVAAPPAGAGELRVELAVSGARAERRADGARLVVDGSSRKLVYSRLRVTDATGRELRARLEVPAPDRLAVAVADAGAAYPVRIDPTFSDENWISMGVLPGTDGQVNVAVIDSAGNLYVGGTFTVVGTAAANRIAKWDGSAWSPLGSGMDAAVWSLAVSGSTLYAGGDFITAGGTSAPYISSWDGSAWSAIGTGMSKRVSALAVSGTTLYAGGTFTSAGGVSAKYIAQWNGSAWSTLGTGMNNYVYALAVSAGTLYAGGTFTKANGNTIKYIAKWDGSAWSALGLGVDYTVYALAVTGSNLFVGGGFSTAGGVSANNIAKWDGSAWSPLGSGVGGTVRALAVSGATLYAGGLFTTVGGNSAPYIARWDGSSWSALGSGMNAWVYALAVSGSGTLYAGGTFTTANGNAANYIAQWDGSAWSTIGSNLHLGMNNGVYVLAITGSTLYAGGDFSAAGGISANRIAKWDGSAWSPLGAGVNDTVNALVVVGDTLYAGGKFTTAGGTSAPYIARWNGSAWSALGSGMDSWVNALAVSGSTLYAGGGFTIAGGFAANNIAQWDGSAWSALGSGLDGSVVALAVIDNTLYAGGGFTTAGGTSANNIASWDGSAWSPLGSGMNDMVWALEKSGATLFAGGAFTTAGEVSANYIASWDGSAWSPLGSGMNNYVHALAMSRNTLYAGGYFTTAGGVPANYIASWDGSTWSPLGSGMNNNVIALAVSGSALYAGGIFTTAGGKVSAYLAQATVSSVTATTTTLRSSANPSAYGDSVMLTATVDQAAATGTVTFKEGATTLGTGSLSGGIATYSTTSFSVGSHSLTAKYEGDANYAASTSSTLTQTVTKVGQSITVSTPAPANATYGVTFTVAAHATSGLVVTYSSGSPTVCTNTGADFTMISGSGSCKIQYDQAGNDTFSPAPQVVETTAAQKATPTITTPPTASSIILGQTLFASSLTGGAGSVSGGFAWTTPTTVPPAGTSSQGITFTPTDSTNYTTATGSTNVTLLVPVTIATATPTGLSITVDGTTYTAPQTFNWILGSSHTIAVPQYQNQIGGTRSAFASWSDGLSLSHNITVPATATTYTATFGSQYQLTTAVNPVGKGTVSPVTGNWFADGTVVNVKGFPNTGYSFVNWSGPVSSAGTVTTTVTMSGGPQTITMNVSSSPALNAAITAASGPATARLWTIKLTNSGQGIASGARITGLTLTQTYGTACTVAPAISSLPIPVSPVDVAAAGGMATGQVTIDFSNCPSTARFTAVISFDANGGSVTGSKSYGNQTR